MLGLRALLLTPPDLLLAAADVYHALTEPRPHRPPLDADHAADELRDQVRRGLLDGEAANAVLRAAGHRAPLRQDWPGGLTGREVEVLRLLARGLPRRGDTVRDPARPDGNLRVSGVNASCGGTPAAVTSDP